MVQQGVVYQPLGYAGVRANRPPNTIPDAQRAPLSTDINYEIGDIWIYPATNSAWMLVSIVAGAATWDPIGTGAIGAITSITGNSGGPIGPAAGGSLTLVGTAGQITVAGSGNTETISLVNPVSNGATTLVSKFTNIPTMSASTGGVAAVTINTYNVWAEPQWSAAFEQYNTTVSTAITPSMSATAGNGLNIDTITGGNAKTIEITAGNTVNSKHAYVVGTSPAFFVQASFNIATLADVADVYLGFRKVQTYQATVPTGYTDYATIGVHGGAGEVELQTQIGSGGNVVTDTTQAVTAATTFTVRVNVSAAGVVTYLFNGAPPAATAAYTFTGALTVVPYLIYTTAAGAHAEVDFVSFQAGLQ